MQVKERYLVIGRDYVACEHRDAEYNYRGVFVAAIIIKQRRSDLNNIYMLNIYLSFHLPYHSILRFFRLARRILQIMNDRA